MDKAIEIIYLKGTLNKKIIITNNVHFSSIGKCMVIKEKTHAKGMRLYYVNRKTVVGDTNSLDHFNFLWVAQRMRIV